MAGDDSKKDEYKLKQKERARLARKAAYAHQKAKMQERKAAQKADPEFKKMQQLKKAEQRQRYKDLKAKRSEQEEIFDDTTRQVKLEERVAKDKVVLASLKLAKDVQTVSLSDDETSPPTYDDPWETSGEVAAAAPRAKLRLVKSGDCS